MPSELVDLPDTTRFQWIIEWGRTSSGSSSAYDVAKYDEDVYDGSAVSWTDASAFVDSFSTRRGKDAFLKRYRAGTARLVLNNTNGRWTGPGSGFTPGDFVRIRVIVDTPNPSGFPAPIPPGTTWTDSTGRLWTSNGSLVLDDTDRGADPYPVFYGRVDSAVDRMRHGVDATLVRLVDLFADLAVIDKDAVPDTGAGETTRERMQRLFTFAAFDYSTVTEFGSEQFTMQATTLAQPALNMMQVTMDSAGGDFWQLPNGGFGIGFTDWLTTAPRSVTVQWMLGNVIGIQDASPSKELQLVVNSASFANTGGTTQTATDAVSISRYGLRTTRRLDLVGDSDLQTQQLATRTVNNLANVRSRVREVRVMVVDEATALFAARAQMGDLALTNVSSFRGWGASYLGHIVGLEFEAVGVNWMLTVSLDDAFVQQTGDGGFDDKAFSTGFDLGSTGG